MKKRFNDEINFSDADYTREELAMMYGDILPVTGHPVEEITRTDCTDEAYEAWCEQMADRDFAERMLEDDAIEHDLERLMANA